eukprot:SAG31_NODE_2085_length_6489_cov_4.027700_1_plen_229_part_10
MIVLVSRSRHLGERLQNKLELTQHVQVPNRKIKEAIALNDESKRVHTVLSGLGQKICYQLQTFKNLKQETELVHNEIVAKCKGDSFAQQLLAVTSMLQDGVKSARQSQQLHLKQQGLMLHSRFGQVMATLAVQLSKRKKLKDEAMNALDTLKLLRNEKEEQQCIYRRLQNQILELEADVDQYMQDSVEDEDFANTQDFDCSLDLVWDGEMQPGLAASAQAQYTATAPKR